MRGEPLICEVVFYYLFNNSRYEVEIIIICPDRGIPVEGEALLKQSDPGGFEKQRRLIESLFQSRWRNVGLTWALVQVPLNSVVQSRPFHPLVFLPFFFFK